MLARNNQETLEEYKKLFLHKKLGKYLGDFITQINCKKLRLFDYNRLNTPLINNEKMAYILQLQYSILPIYNT